jgi:hypothetical protein
MPVWSIQFYDEINGFQPSRYGAVKADNEGTAFVLAKENMKDAQRAEVIRMVVRDEAAFQDGYRETSSIKF